MTTVIFRAVLFAVLVFFLCTGAAWAAPDLPPPSVANASFECAQGYGAQPGIVGQVPNGWTASLLFGRPELNSTRLKFTGECGDDGFVERLEGLDSLVFLSEDIETPPLPGKTFDAAVYQRIAVTPGTAYSLSGWLVSLCGGSAIPNDCPSGYYIAKLLGLDPTGGTDPASGNVIWMEDRRNFTESRWANLRLAATAQSDHVTLFVRVRSPFQWHGAHAFADAISLVRAPLAWFVDLPASVPGSAVTVRWDGSQSPDIAAIPGGTYQLLFDVQMRKAGQQAWMDWQTDRPAGQATFVVDPCLGPQTFQFRVRTRSEQPPGSGGAWPNHRFPGDWSAPASVTFLGETACQPAVFLPLIWAR
ncbi:MAG: hypothetical protein R2844_23010 [Caldilineales bacterium]